ncbi:MAG: VCBS repeat-containing protein, partial [Phycisphaerales bacterium]|nr:VCBS repeat-containing protein [Phycisphaerales bacterium]
MNIRTRNLAAALTPLALVHAALAGACVDPQYDSVDLPAGQFPRAVALGDLDGDGDLDIAVANASTTSGIIIQGTEGLHVILNNGDGTFAPAQFYAAGYAPQSIALGDIDGDGDL